MNGYGTILNEVTQNNEIVLDIRAPLNGAYRTRKGEWEFNIPMLVGDCNLDNTINIVDIIYAVNIVLNYNSDYTIFDLFKIDLNLDQTINISDIVSLVNLVLN